MAITDTIEADTTTEPLRESKGLYGANSDEPSLPQVQTKKRKKRLQVGGHPTKITLDTVVAVANMVIDGYPLKYACASMPIPFTAEHFLQSIGANSVLAHAYNKTLGSHIAPLVQSIKGATSRELPSGTLWFLERMFPEEFASNKGKGGVTVNVQTIVGIGEDIRARVSAHVRTGKSPAREKPCIRERKIKEITGQQ
jgi:hypothetical protein